MFGNGPHSNAVMPPQLILFILGAVSLVGAMSARAQDVSRTPPVKPETHSGLAIPSAWTRRGVVLERQRRDQGVSGDTCIVWDEAIQGWRMVLFYDPPGQPRPSARSAMTWGRDNGSWKVPCRSGIRRRWADFTSRSS